MRILKGKKGIAMPFNWIFAFIVGGFILFLAIFAAVKIISTSEQRGATETAASFISLFDPLETGPASGKAYEINFKKKSKIYFSCDENSGFFGRQYISFVEKTFGEKYSEAGRNVSIKDKYIFVDDKVEGKSFYLFSKPFFMPFKIIDQSMIISKDNDYCFYDSPRYFRESLENLNLNNTFFLNESQKCDGIKICFQENNLGCEINVYEDDKYVLNKIHGKRVYYIDDLIYGAVFSSPEIYECNVKRMKIRFDELSKIYLDKIKVIEREDCRSNVGAKLLQVIGPINNSRDLILLNSNIKEIESINKLAESNCQLW